ncbi:MAG: hypothetical protein SGJ11_09975 [Phycisphaerae bacterium]|nr:hypothetical protein [Phycisphaerae bacterium]
MAIRTSIQPGQLYRIAFLGLLCVGFGIWGAYDYWVKIPAQEALVAEHTALLSTKDALEAKQLRGTLSTAEETELTSAREALALRFLEAPTPPAAYDRPVQLWVYVIGCGVLGVPSVAWMLWSIRRKQYELTDDGSLITPEGTCRIDEVKGIDMSRWMEKSIAMVTLPDGSKSVLDDYKYKNLHLIIGALAHRFHPDEWTIEARRILKPAPDAATSDGQ